MWQGMKSYFLWLLLVCVCAANAADDERAEQLYEQYKLSVYRIDVINSGSNKKSSLGTGFVVGNQHTLASNFHVVSAAIHDPDNFRLEYQRSDGERGKLRVIAVDVVHDLSLLQAENELGQPFALTTLPRKGTTLFSMGHPLALDLSIVTGSANGLLEKALYDKILFSGNINPGMSGGPAINARGMVVGINVATSGNGVGYLVPANYLQKLIANSSLDDNAQQAIDLQQAIGLQLLWNQQQIVDDVTRSDWPTQKIGKFVVPGELSSRLDCWGETQNATEKEPYMQISTNCTGQDDIFLSERQRAGSIAYQYFWLQSEELSPRAFYKLYQQQHSSVFLSEANETDVGNFQCSVRFVRIARQSFKANVCARPYKRYQGLHDVMVLMAMTGHRDEGLMFTLDMSAVTLDNGLKLLKRFLERFEWQP